MPTAVPNDKPGKVDPGERLHAAVALLVTEGVAETRLGFFQPPERAEALRLLQQRLSCIEVGRIFLKEPAQQFERIHKQSRLLQGQRLDAEVLRRTLP